MRKRNLEVLFPSTCQSSKMPKWGRISGLGICSIVQRHQTKLSEPAYSISHFSSNLLQNKIRCSSKDPEYSQAFLHLSYNCKQLIQLVGPISGFWQCENIKNGGIKLQNPMISQHQQLENKQQRNTLVRLYTAK